MKKTKEVLPEGILGQEPDQLGGETGKPKFGRARRIWRTALIWMVVVSAALLAGVLIYHFVRYKPANETLIQTQSELSQVKLANDDFTARLAIVDEEVAGLESSNQALQSEVSTTKAHLELLKVLVDVSNARIALFLEDTTSAKSALTNTTQRLEILLPSIAEYDANLAQSMPQRLNIIINGLDRDIATAKIDLELFTKDLLEVEAALFGN
jgi:septal ring factor EnvC (AmiA/AmiB activator)